MPAGEQAVKLRGANKLGKISGPGNTRADDSEGPERSIV
jgi:hypothetical protein